MGHRGGDGTTFCTVCSGGARGAIGTEKEGRGSEQKTSWEHTEDWVAEVVNG